MVQLRLTWELACKDLRLFIADRRGAVLCFAVPIVLASVFGAIFHQPAAGTVPRVPLLLVVEDDGSLTARVVAGLRASAALKITQCDRATARQHLVERTGGVALVLPAGFGELHAGSRQGEKRLKPELLHHPDAALESRWVEGVFTEIVLRESARDLFGPLAGSAAADLQDSFAVKRSTVPDAGDLAANAYNHSFCGMTVQYLLFWGMDSGLLALRERRQGIWRRLRAAPLGLPTLLAGKTLATALVALAQIGTTLGFGAVVFGVTLRGSRPGLALLALSAALLSAATGLLVAAVGRNELRARSVAVLAILTLSLLGGLWIPAFLLPAWVQQLAWVFPTTWAIRGLEGVTWQGMGLGAAARCAIVILAFSGSFLLFALWGFWRAETCTALRRDSA